MSLSISVTNFILKDVEFSRASFDLCETGNDHPNAHANAKKWIFDITFPGNDFEFSTIKNDF